MEIVALPYSGKVLSYFAKNGILVFVGECVLPKDKTKMFHSTGDIFEKIGKVWPLKYNLLQNRPV